MAWQTSKRVWDFVPQNVTGSERLMLLALAEKSDEHGICWPSYAALAKMVGVNERSAIRLIDNLEKSDLIYINKQQGQNGGRGYTNVYFVTVGLDKSEVETTKAIHPMLIKGVSHNTLIGNKRVLPVTEKGVMADIKGVTGNTRTIIEPSIKELSTNVEQPPLKNKTRERPAIIPAYKVFTEITNYFAITIFWRNEMAATIGELPDDLEFWRKVVIGWTGKYPSKHNVEGMLDFYKRREIPGYQHQNGVSNGHNRQITQQTHQSQTQNQVRDTASSTPTGHAGYANGQNGSSGGVGKAVSDALKSKSRASSGGIGPQMPALPEPTNPPNPNIPAT